jgi:DNA gyrase/topoisomerase IV subunit A
MNVERPDLSGVGQQVRAYIEALEAELDHRRQAQDLDAEGAAETASFEPAEPPTTINLITISARGRAKRTPRHLYSRQRRGGMGIFDLETTEDDPPTLLALADESQSLLLVTNLARAFRVSMRDLPESPVRSRGQSLVAQLPLLADERITLALPDQGKGYIALVSQHGHVRCLRHHYVGENLRPGTNLYTPEFGPPAAACWTPGNSDLFIATRQGHAIRFAEKQVPLQGCLGIRLEPEDVVVGITAAHQDSGVLLVSADGKGTIRLMSGFSPNKMPGGGGKTAMRTDCLIGAATVDESDDFFIISRLSKIIRSRAAEIPAKEDAVQGVNCMALRADETMAVISSSPISYSALR